MLLDSRIITAGRDLTRARLRTALSSVQKFDLGVLGAGGRFLG